MEDPASFSSSLGLRRVQSKQSKPSRRESAKPNTRLLDDGSGDDRGRDVKSKKLFGGKSGSDEEWMSTQRVDKRDFIFDLGRAATHSNKPSKPLRSYLRDSDGIKFSSKQADNSNSSSSDDSVKKHAKPKNTIYSEFDDLVSGIDQKKQTTVASDESSSEESSSREVQLLRVKQGSGNRLKDQIPHDKLKRPQIVKKHAKPKNANGHQIDYLVSGISKGKHTTVASDESSSSEESSSEDVQLLRVKQGSWQRLQDQTPHDKHKQPQTVKNCVKPKNAVDHQIIDDSVSGKSKKQQTIVAGDESNSSEESSSNNVELLRVKQGARQRLKDQSPRDKHKRPQYESSSSEESSIEDVRVVRVKQRQKQSSFTKRTSKLKNIKSFDRQTHADNKVAKIKAKEAEIPRSITSTSQLRWYKIRIKRKKKWELNIRPCRVLNSGEVSRVKNTRRLSPKKGDAIVQFLSFPDEYDICKSVDGDGEVYECVDDTALFPFNDLDTGALDMKSLDEYAEQQKSKVSRSLFVEAEKLWLMRVFEFARRVETNSRTIACQDRNNEQNYTDSNLDMAHVRFRTPDTAKLECTKSSEASDDDEELGTPRPIFEEEEEDQVDEDYLDCPYTQAMNFDPDMNNLDDEVSNEPMRPGDVIEYYSPIFVVGDKRGLRQATVLGIDPTADVILNLSNAECLPNDTRVKRIRVIDGNELYDHPGIFRPIETFKLVAGKVKGSKSGVMNEAARFGDIFRRNLSKMQAKAEADGFAPMDMLRNMPGGKGAKNDAEFASNSIGSRITSTPNQHSRQPMLHHSASCSSESESSTNVDVQTYQSPYSLNSPANRPDHRGVPSKPSPPSLKRAMNCSDGLNRLTHQKLQQCPSSSSSDGSARETLTELAKQKYASQCSAASKYSNIGKENINNSHQEKKLIIEYADVPAALNTSPTKGRASASLGASLASSASLGSSLDSTSSSDESVAMSPSKYRKVVTRDPLKLQETTSSKADLSAESSSESSLDGSSKQICMKTPVNPSRRSLLSEDDIEDSDDELMSSRNRRGKSTKRNRGLPAPRLSRGPSRATWTEGKSGLEKSTGSRGLMFSRHK